MNYFNYNSPLGKLVVFWSDAGIQEIEFNNSASNRTYKSTMETSEQIESELNSYFKGEAKEFSIGLKPIGTDFQKQVWNALKEIPYGETVAYSDIAERIGNPRGVRAVGSACKNNPIPIIVPCHRVVGKNGSLTGYAGGLKNKKILLDLEAKNK